MVEGTASWLHAGASSAGSETSPAVSPSTERGCLMCAHSPAFHQLSKSDGQKRD